MRRFIIVVLSFISLNAIAAFKIEPLNQDFLQKQLISHFGPSRVVLLKDWIHLIDSMKSMNDEAKLKQINNFINQNILFDSDLSVWHKKDYWATPLETIGQGRGDCEDFAIIKYVSLRLAGIPSNKLRLIYVKMNKTMQAHVVLAYYANPNNEPIILDNIENSILPASKCKKMRLIFSFNSDGIFSGISGMNDVVSSISSFSKWNNVLHNIEGELSEKTYTN